MRKRFTKQYQLEKQNRKLYEELNEIYKKETALPYIEVEPYQRGWEIHITLKDDILNRKDAEFLLLMLSVGYMERSYYGSTRDVSIVRMVREGRLKLPVSKYSHMSCLIPKRYKFSEEQYNAFPERWRKYFSKYRHSYYTDREYYKLNISPQWLRLKIKPHIITKERDIDPNLMSRKQEIYNELDRSSMYSIGKKSYRDEWTNPYQSRSKLKAEYLKEQRVELKSTIITELNYPKDMKQFTLKFYNKYDLNQSVTIKDISEEDAKRVQQAFKDRDMLSQNADLTKNLGAQIDLSQFSYVEYLLQKED